MQLPDSATLGRRHARVRQAFDRLAIDALIVTTPSNIRYLTNHTGTAGVLLVTTTAIELLVDFRYLEAVRAREDTAAACPSLEVRLVPASYDEAVVDALLDCGVLAPGVEAAHLTVGRYHWLRKALRARGSSLELRSTDAVVEEARVIKDAWEIAVIREGAARLPPVWAAAAAAARGRGSERAVARAIEAAIQEAGYEGIAFETIVASGPNSGRPHHRASDRALTDGDLVVLDFGGVLSGYCCDLTRTATVGPATAAARRLHAAVLEAQQAAIEAVRPGTAASAVDHAARSVLDRHGLGEAFGHGTGHGLGLEVHEAPRVNKLRTDVPAVLLQPGMVFTVEPGVYVPTLGGVRIEDDVLVTETGCEVLTGVPRELLAL